MVISFLKREIPLNNKMAINQVSNAIANVKYFTMLITVSKSMSFILTGCFLIDLSSSSIGKLAKRVVLKATNQNKRTSQYTGTLFFLLGLTILSVLHTAFIL